MIWLPSWVPWDVVPDKSADTDEKVVDMIEQIGESDPDVEDELASHANEMASQSNVPVPELEDSDALVRMSGLQIGLT